MNSEPEPLTYREERSGLCVVARNFYLLLLVTCSAWPCLGPAEQDLSNLIPPTSVFHASCLKLLQVFFLSPVQAVRQSGFSIKRLLPHLSGSEGQNVDRTWPRTFPNRHRNGWMVAAPRSPLMRFQLKFHSSILPSKISKCSFWGQLDRLSHFVKPSSPFRMSTTSVPAIRHQQLCLQH